MSATRVSAIEEKLRGADEDLRAMANQVAAIRVGVGAAEQYPVGPSASYCEITVSGTVSVPCNTTPVPGIFIEFTAQPSGIKSLLSTDDTGSFSGTVVITDEDDSLAIETESPFVYYANVSSTYGPVACGGTYAGLALSLTLAVGWDCCNVPVPTTDTMTLVVPIYGTITLSYLVTSAVTGTSGGFWVGYFSGPFAGGPGPFGACGAVNPYWIGFAYNPVIVGPYGSIDIFAHSPLDGRDCPVADAFTGFPTASGVITRFDQCALGGRVCTPSYSATATISGSGLSATLWPSGGTMTLTHP